MVDGLLSDADLAKLDAPTLESCLLDTWKVVRHTGIVGVDECIATEMEKNIERYVLGVASLKGHLAAEHFQMSMHGILLSDAAARIVSIYRVVIQI